MEESKKLEKDDSAMATQLKSMEYMDVPRAALLGTGVGFIFANMVELICLDEADETEKKIKRTLHKKEQYRLRKDLMHMKFAGIGRTYIFGAVTGATLYVTYYGVQNCFTHKRGIINKCNGVTSFYPDLITFGLLHKFKSYH